LITTIILDPDNVTNYYNFITKGYYEEDLNMDGNVIFQGPGNDRGPQLFQVILNHEDNDLVLPNFIVKDGLPD